MNIRATSRHFSFLASCVTGYDVTVVITDDPSYVGFTSMPTNGRANITLSYTTSLYVGMNEVKRTMMMLGVLAHECMHLCYTNFDAYNLKSIVLSRASDKLTFQEINNVVEDPAIEFFASRKIGGKMLKALSAIIKHTWITAPSIESDIPVNQAENYAYTQIIRALIQLGDRGVLKGQFLSKTAKDTFAKILPLFNAAVVESDGAKRVDYSVEIYKILEPLSRAEAQKTAKQLDKGCPIQMPNGMGEGISCGKDIDDNDSADATTGNRHTSAEKKQALRQQLERKLSESDTQSIDKSQGEDNANTPNTMTEPNGSPLTSTERPHEMSTLDEDDLTNLDEDMEFLDNDFESLMSDIEHVETQLQISEAAEKALIAKSAKELPIDTPEVVNHVADNPNESRYNDIVNAYSSKIVTLTNELRKIFSSDRSKVKTANHGSRVNAKRLVDGKLHSNILLSRISPKDLDNMAVYILVDKSGSMSKTNSRGKRNDQCAAETAICLYEALHNLRVPVYITGFTTRGTKSVHVHYVTWNSPKSHRYTLANFAADDCNYDFYSIMEATRILRKHQAKHKVLIVISDGAPCDISGSPKINGVEATTAAVEQAKKTISVLGVAMNCYDEDVYASMYGKDYITVSTANDIFLPIANALKNIVKSW